MIELTLADGEPVMVNPHFVVSIQKHWDPYTVDDGLSDVVMANGGNGWVVRGTVREVLAALQGRHSTGQHRTDDHNPGSGKRRTSPHARGL
jgi:uncharacterized protein YlzI (FlbEa/FlbD family)